MPRTPKARFSTLAEVAKLPPVPPVQGVPLWLLRAVVRGLHDSFYSRKRHRFEGVPPEQLEAHVCRFVESIAWREVPPNLSAEQLVKHTAKTFLVWLDDLDRPLFYTLHKDTALILDELKPFGKIRNPAARVVWLHEQLPRIFISLKNRTSVPPLSSPQRTSIPEDHDLQLWAANPAIGRLRDRILAHHHNLAELEVRKRLSSPPK